MAIQRILGTDTGKAAFTKTDDNFVEVYADVAGVDADLIAHKADYTTRFGKITKSITDCNTAIETGIYEIQNNAVGVVNPPISSGYSHLFVSQRNSSAVAQLALVRPAASSNTRIFARHSWTGIWSNWVELWNTANTIVDVNGFIKEV